MNQYPPHLITLFVASEEEKEKYLRATPQSYFGHIVVGKLGLAEQKNFIKNFYGEGEIICQMDDDIDDVKSLNKMSFLELVEKGVREIEANGVGLFGILPNADGRRFKDDTTYHLTFIIGAFFICRNHKDMTISYCEKEDYQRSILYFQRYGKVARYRGAGLQTTYNKGSGGLICDDRAEKMEIGANMMVSLYPGYCKKVIKNGLSDLALNWRATPPT